MKRARWLLALGILLVAMPAGAQVNAETLRPDPSRRGVERRSTRSFALMRGNVELSMLAARAA